LYDKQRLYENATDDIISLLLDCIRTRVYWGLGRSTGHHRTSEKVDYKGAWESGTGESRRRCASCLFHRSRLDAMTSPPFFITLFFDYKSPGISARFLPSLPPPHPPLEQVDKVTQSTLQVYDHHGSGNDEGFVVRRCMSERSDLSISKVDSTAHSLENLLSKMFQSHRLRTTRSSLKVCCHLRC
jgi:hypothetical protein